MDPKLAQAAGSVHDDSALYRVTPGDGAAFCITVKGRVRWALDALCDAGARGCAAIENPAPRWSAYVFDLRALGVEIETLHEAHGGPYPGKHGRYVLRCDVRKGGAE